MSDECERMQLLNSDLGRLRLAENPSSHVGQAWAFSIGAHLVLFVALWWLHIVRPTPDAQPILVGLVEIPKPEPPGPPVPEGAFAPSAPVQSAAQVKPQPTPARPPSPDADETAAVDTFSDVLTEAQIAGAAGASGNGGGGGAGGGGCDMAQALQLALRRAPTVRTALANANRLGKSIMIWNGDWVRSGAQDGKGLSAVREVIMWEVAFAPEVCRQQRMQGLMLLSLDGDTRFAIGSDDWRWSDLLGIRPSKR